MADTLSTTQEPRDETVDGGGGGTNRPPRGLPRRVGASWLGLGPFFAYILIFFLPPVCFILYNAFL